MGLLDGDIANLVATALVGAGLSKPAVLTKVTPGTRIPGAISAGTQPTTVNYACQGIEASLTQLQASGTLISGVVAAIRIFGATLPAGVTPAPSDKIAIAGVTYTIAGEAFSVTRDAAGACFVCQCRR